MDVFTPISFTSVPTGLSSFSTANKKNLETNLENILTNAFRETFNYTSPDGTVHNDFVLGDQMAKNFGKGAAPQLASVIDDYVQQCIKSQMITITPKTLMSPTGPVSGTASTLTSDITIN